MNAPPRFYVANSLRGRFNARGLRRLGAWLDADVVQKRPLPPDRTGLVFSKDEVRLHTPGQKAQLWHPGMVHRRRRLVRDPLAEAIGLRPGETVLDGTLGMGHDALMLAVSGAEVHALECIAALLFFTLDGIRRHAPHVAGRIHARRADHREWLAAAAPGSVDHVYLDPMFPPAVGGESTTWVTLRGFTLGAGETTDQRPTADTLRAAWRAARRTVALKLAPFEPPPQVPDLPPARLEGSRRVHFAVWRR
ncbi:MAG: class I SAM-dependent methyltransferase [Myxococcales bacterium]|nr:class I SAM-dependent methyltransferase [Myxococcales bacterium]